MFQFSKKKLNKKVFLGLSGGVDSSVSAALLLEQGYDVVGVFIRVWQPEWLKEMADTHSSCTQTEDRRDAMRVCAHLNIPFVELNLEEEYKREVADYMIEEYKKGRTPNPDVMCNKSIKFGGFLKWALAKGADYVATGHYAQIKNSKFGVQQFPTSTLELLEGKDAAKDQSYFLWTLTAEHLKHILFPVGHLQKSDVRKLAKKFNLPTAVKKDSQGICFLGKVDMKDFLRHYVAEKKGKVLNEKGEVIGHHPGALFFTLGERHGFTVTKKGTDDAPYYVVGKDIKKNTLTVSHTSFVRNQVAEVRLESVNMISEKLRPGKIYEARIRYRGKRMPCQLSSISSGAVTLMFKDEDRTISSGQSLVLFDGEKCVGGGIIA